MNGGRNMNDVYDPYEKSDITRDFGVNVVTYIMNYPVGTVHAFSILI